MVRNEWTKLSKKYGFDLFPFAEIKTATNVVL